MTLPAALTHEINLVLHGSGDVSPIRYARHVGGGDINQAARIETAEARYFVKWLNNAPPRFFECESAGLRVLASIGVSRVPLVIGATPALLILEWIDTAGKSEEAAERLGRQLAEQHRIPQAYYGLDYDNYIGKLTQPNQRSDSWIAFYTTQRLGAQMTQAQANGVLPAQRRRLLERVMQKLPDWLSEADCQPSLLHGDLWGGNWMQSAAGEPVLIDPAVYYGDREADLAMTTLFGGFPPTFYDAYNEVFPLTAGYQDRQPLYQLYYLLCHLNLFGESYGHQVDSVLRRYGS